MNLIPLISIFITINIINTISDFNVIYFSFFFLWLWRPERKYFCSNISVWNKTNKNKSSCLFQTLTEESYLKTFPFLCCLVFFVFTEWIYSEESKSTRTKYIRDKTTQTDCHIVFLRQTGRSQQHLKSLDPERWKNTREEV